MPTKHSHILPQGEQSSPDSENQNIETVAPTAECDGQSHPAAGDDALDYLEQSGENIPRWVIRGKV